MNSLSQRARHIWKTCLQPRDTGCRERSAVRSHSTLVLVSLVASILFTSSPLMAKETITPLMSGDLANFTGREALTYTVDFPPGFSSPVHRHNAFV